MTFQISPDPIADSMIKPGILAAQMLRNFNPFGLCIGYIKPRFYWSIEDTSDNSQA